MKTQDTTSPLPAAAGPQVRLRSIAASLPPYQPPAAGFQIDLPLDANEGPAMRTNLEALIAALPPDAICRYTTPDALERTLAQQFEIDPAQIIVTAGGDEAIDRACRICLEPGRTLIFPEPSFEMIGRSARLAGAEIVSTPWPGGPFPIEAVLDLISERTAMIAVVTPNNPTGAVASRDDLIRLSAAAPETLLLVDLAYTEFADEDLTNCALSLPNAVIIRTFSKAYGLAGLRVGYAMASPGGLHFIRAMRAVGAPYPVSAISLAVAANRVRRSEEFLPAAVARIRAERNELAEELGILGARVQPSQANFVLADFATPAAAACVWRGLASLGIAVRRFDSRGSTSTLRITCPCDAGDTSRLIAALRATMHPQALLFDMDGVLADVSRSYRRAIVLTAESFGITISPQNISAAKARDGMNNDWHLTRTLLAERGVDVPLSEVTERFERFYHGTPDAPGLEASEMLIPAFGTLQRLAARMPLGIVTGRPRRDCTRFLERFGLARFFSAVVCMEDTNLKPDPAPVRLALSKLGISAAWLVGDTPDDIAASREAGVLPIGIVPPGEQPDRISDVLTRAGAAAILNSLDDLEGLLP